MTRLIPVLIFIILLSSCRKSEKNDFIWEKTYGKGEALFLRTSADSGFIACGKIDGKPYFIRLNKNRGKTIDFTSGNPGLFNSAWFDESGYVIGGNSGGQMSLMRYSPAGNKLWEKSIVAGFRVDYTNLYFSGNGNFLAVGTASPDSSGSGAAGLFFVRFDTTGQIITEINVPGTDFVSAGDATVDNAGNIYLALTRKSVGSKPKASVAKFNELFQKLWETDLYNNPDFGAACHAIKIDGSGNVYVSGNTELSGVNGILNNSFIASLTNTGSIIWKKYLEDSNSGSALIFNEAGDLMMLNRNCFIINVLSPSDGSDAGRLRMFSLCDSYNTDALGADLGINYDRNILVAGSRGGSFYLALKAVQ